MQKETIKDNNRTMNFTFYILIFFIFIIPFSILKRIYLFDRTEFKIAKITNVVCCILLIWYISIQGDNFRSLIFDFQSFRTKYLIDVGFLNRWIIFSNQIISIILSAYLAIVVFNLSRRNAIFRRRFLYLIPFIVLVDIIDEYRFGFLKFGGENSPNEFVLFVFLGLILIFTPVFFIYNSKKFHKMMFLDNKKIKDLILTE